MSKWKFKKLGDISEVKSGGTPTKAIKEYWSGNISWYSSGELNSLWTKDSKEKITKKGLNESNAKLFPKGSLLIGMYDTAALKMSLLDREAAFNQAISGVKPNDYIDLKFVFYSINAQKLELLKSRRGVRQKNLNLSKIKNIAIPVPPIAEQRRIVEILDEAFEEIDRAEANTKKNLANAIELFDSYLNKVFTEKGDGWVKKSLNEECEILMGQSPKGSSYNSDGIGVPLINGPVEFGGIDPFSKTVATKFTTEPKKMCEKNDLILCVRGSTTGRMNIAGQEACIGRGVAAIRSKHNNQDWINHFISFRQSLIYSLGSGSTFPNVSSSALKEITIPFPPEQQRKSIVKNIQAISEDIENLRNIYQRKLEALAELKQSILQKAFTGKLTT